MSYGFTNSYLARIEQEAQARAQAQREQLLNDIQRDAFERTPNQGRCSQALRQRRTGPINSLVHWLRARRRRTIARVSW